MRRFLKEQFPERGGYVNERGDKVELLWQRGEDPRFELVEAASNEVVEYIPLDDKSLADLEAMLAKYGFSPQKKHVLTKRGMGGPEPSDGDFDV